MYAIALAVLGFAIGSTVSTTVAVVLATLAAFFGVAMDKARSDRKRKEARGATRSGKSARVSTGSSGPSKAADGLPAYKAMYNDLEIVGESYRQDIIRRLWRGADVTFKAALIPEDDNQYDRNAVRVEVEGLHVGYLSRDAAEQYRGYMGDGACAIPVHFIKGGNEGTIGVFPGRCKADNERVRREG